MKSSFDFNWSLPTRGVFCASHFPSPRLGKSFNGFCSMAIDFFESSQRLFPLSEGEGQGEGKRSGFASSFPFASPTIFQGTA